MPAYTTPAIGITQAEALGSVRETVAVRAVVLATAAGEAAAVAKELTNLLAQVIAPG